MERNANTAKRWQFSAGVLAPVILSLLATGAGVLGFVLWSTSDMDTRFVQRQARLVANVIGDEVARVSFEQESVAVWDDAVVNTKLQFDRAWIDINLGAWTHNYFGHDLAVVLNDRNDLIYEYVAPGLPRSNAVDLKAGLLPLVARLREQIGAGALATYKIGVGATLPHVTDLMIIGGVPAIVSLVPVVTDTGTIEQATGSEFIHVAVQRLDAAVANNFASKYLLDGGNFTTVRSNAPGRAVYPLSNSGGRLLGFFEWQPDRPGQQMLGSVAPALAGAFLLAGLIVFVLLDRLWRSSSALESGRRIAVHDASHDALTGLPNRARFDQELERALDRGATDGREIALLMLDLDQFKHVNDTLGHPAGDKLIQAAGHRLQKELGESDVICRLGGDEFAILSHVEAGSQVAVEVAQRLIDSLGGKFDIDDNEVFVGLSIGIAYAHENSTPFELVRNADIALYEAKARGRNRSVVYEERMNELLQLRRIIEAELREALRRDDQLTLAFQPLIDGKTGEVIGAEALARWNHPKFGEITPSKFIPVAESTGLIDALGDFILKNACELGARWPGRRIAVNVSPAQLRNPKFPLRVFKMLKQSGMRAADLELEITESILLEDRHVIVEALRSFRHAGIEIALDDFGTGYSSLAYLKRYEVDRIKIDRSFIMQVTENEASAEIVRAMVTLAHALELEVTAEGVETRDQQALLVALGCDALQGFHFSRPVPAAVIEGMLATGSWSREPAPVRRWTA